MNQKNNENTENNRILDELNLLVTLQSRENYKEKISNIPHRDYFDMVMIVKYTTDHDIDSDYYADVTYEVLEKLCISEDELFDRAFSYMVNHHGIILKKISDIVKLMNDNLTDVEDNEMIYCLTNRCMFLGSGNILLNRVPRMIYDVLGEDYYIIPANIHEMLLIPSFYENINICEIRDYILKINSYILKQEENLSKKVLYYDSKNDEIVGIS